MVAGRGLAKGSDEGMNGQRKLSSASRLISIEEAALRLNISKATAYRAIKTGNFPLPVIQLGGRVKVSGSSALSGVCTVVTIQPEHAGEGVFGRSACSFSRCETKESSPKHPCHHRC